MASLSGTFVYRLFISKKNDLFSESNLVFFAASVLVSKFASSILSNILASVSFNFSYDHGIVRTDFRGVFFLCTSAIP